MMISDALKQAITTLRVASESASRDADVLLCHVLGKPLTFLRTHPERELTDDEHKRFAQLINERLLGEPIAYIVGEKEFWSLPFEVNKDTLIPRPETELLVEETLAHLSDRSYARVVDLGTGSGVIALTLASERKDWSITATDASLAALRMAQKNARKLALDNVHFEHGFWFQPLATQRFDAVVSNPPYIPEHDPHLSKGDLRYEPESALVSGADGLSDIRVIVHQSTAHLNPRGWLLLEHGFDQAEVVRALMEHVGFKHVKSLHDLAGHERITVGQWLPIEEAATR